MASKKDKFLENAQKFVAKGQLDRAIREYEQVVALDPKDTRYRQRLAELLVRVNRKDEAISEYDTIAKFYAENSYHLKAIAVYKQIQKLDPGNINISLSLASLNEKQGMTANALAEYDQVCNYYLSSEQYKEALKVIDKMLAADPENLNTRLKLAETEFSACQTEKAYEDFIKLLSTLQQRNNMSVFKQIAERVQSLFPDRQEFVLDLIETTLKEGNATVAAERLQEFLRSHGNSARGWQLLADALLADGKLEQCKEALLRMEGLSPQDLSVHERLVKIHLQEGEWGAALDLLQAKQGQFLAADASALLEKFYLELHEQQPGDIRVLQGLLDVYAADGEQQKQTAIQTKIDHLRAMQRSKPAVPEAPSYHEPEPEMPSFPAPPAEASVASAPAAAPEADDSLPSDHWEEELDLTFLDDEGPAPEPPQDESVQPEGDEEPEPEELPLSFEESSEIRDLFADFEDEGSAHEVEEADDLSGSLELPDFDEALDLVDDQGGADAEELEDVEDLEVAEELEDVEELGAPEEFEDAEELADAEEVQDLEELEDEVTLGDAPPLMEQGFNLDFADDELDVLAGVLPAVPKQQPSGMIRIEEPVDEGDAETHYNLGIAYKEMGLLDEAVQELRLAARSRERRFACLTLEGICYRDKGDMTMAEEVYRGGIALPGLTVNEKASLTFELAFLYETMGRAEEAIQLYREVLQLDPHFRDVGARIAFLQGSGGEHDHYELDLEGLEELE